VYTGDLKYTKVPPTRKMTNTRLKNNMLITKFEKPFANPIMREL
jgi:hypothetical protein